MIESNPVQRGQEAGAASFEAALLVVRRGGEADGMLAPIEHQEERQDDQAPEDQHLVAQECAQTNRE